MFLNCHSYYSLRYGCLSEKQLIEQALSKGISTLALTDINNTSACINFIRLSQEAGLKPVVGIDFRNGVDQQFVGLARNNKGFFELNHFLTHHLHHSKPFARYAPPLQECYIIYPLHKVLNSKFLRLEYNEFIGVSINEVNKIKLIKNEEWLNKMVVLHTVSFASPGDFNTHRLLRAIDNNTLLSKLPKSEEGHADQTMLSKDEIKLAFGSFPQLLANTIDILDTCSIHFDISKDRPPVNIKHYGQSESDDEITIRNLCEEGLRYRYSHVTKKIRQRLEKELALIKHQNFISYFLVNWDITKYARSQGYFYVGRGSGANSLVAYLLRITDVDPMDLDLYFERFMNLFRNSPPDFDIDFSWKDREDVTRYIFDRFGKQGQVALLGTYNTFQKKAAIRELSKVFGLPKEETDNLVRGNYDRKCLDKISNLILIYSNRLLGMPNYRSIHAGGIVISQYPINHFTATDMPPKGFPTTHFDMIIAEDIGLYKLDILGQRGLAKIKEAVKLVEQNYPPEERDFEISNIASFIIDPKVNALIKEARCIGCFYVESPAMRMLLKKLEVDNYLGLVAASSIIRPGVARSGMMREYILRHKNPKRRNNAHPVLAELMPETYGVMVYQEDVIKVAHHFAGLSLAEADVLRRGMSGKFRSREDFLKVQDQFVKNCIEKGYERKIISEVWHQIESFAGYAFAKGHSASYAVESYQCLFLKTYYPLEYMTAVLNNGGGFYRAEIYIHEARMLGATIHAPCINRSSLKTSISGSDIMIGMHYLEGIESNVIVSIVEEREANGHFRSLNDFMDRIMIEPKQLDILIRIGAFRFTEVDSRTLLWQAHYQLNHQVKLSSQSVLFKKRRRSFELPTFKTSALEEAFTQIELLGFPLCNPFLLLESEPKSSLKAKQLKKVIGRRVIIYGYLVSVKRTRTSGGKRMFFGTFLDMDGNFIDTVHFPPVANKYPFRGHGIYHLCGKVIDEFGFYSIEIDSMVKMPYKADPRYKAS